MKFTVQEINIECSKLCVSPRHHHKYSRAELINRLNFWKTGLTRKSIGHLTRVLQNSDVGYVLEFSVLREYNKPEDYMFAYSNEHDRDIDYHRLMNIWRKQSVLLTET